MLGVAPGATAAEIRDAYRRLARARHPDRTGGSDDAMAALNDAYRVLGDPRRRSTYDAGLRTVGSAAGPSTRPSSTVGTTAAPVRPARVEPARFPWRLSIVAAVVGAIVVLAMAALSEPAGPAPPDNVLEPGSCVLLIESDRSASEVACDDSALYEVSAFVSFDEACPQGTMSYRDRQGRGTACVVAIAES